MARWIGATCTVCALGLLVISQATSFWLCAAVLFAIGFAATLQMAATNTIIQQRVPDEMRSRLMAVYATLFMGVQPIGSLLATFFVKRLGAPHGLLLLGVFLLVACVVFLLRVILKVKPQQPVVAGTVPSV